MVPDLGQFRFHRDKSKTAGRDVLIIWRSQCGCAKVFVNQVLIKSEILLARPVGPCVFVNESGIHF